METMVTLAPRGTAVLDVSAQSCSIHCSFVLLTAKRGRLNILLHSYYLLKGGQKKNTFQQLFLENGKRYEEETFPP